MEDSLENLDNVVIVDAPLLESDTERDTNLSKQQHGKMIKMSEALGLCAWSFCLLMFETVAHSTLIEKDDINHKPLA